MGALSVRTYGIVLAIIGIMLFAAAGWYILERTSVVERVQIATKLVLPLPEEAHSAHYLLETERGRIPLHIQDLQLVFDARTGPVFAASHGSDGKLLAVVDLPGPSSVGIKLGMDTLFVSTSTITSLALSPDAAAVAYADASMNVEVFASTTGKVLALGKGSAPFFLVDGPVARFTAEGILVTDLSTGAESVIPDTESFGMPVHARLSTDRKHIGWIEPASGMLRVFEISGTSIRETASIPAPLSFDLGAEGLYILRMEKNAIELWLHDFDGSGGKRLTAFPPGVKIVDMIL